MKRISLYFLVLALFFSLCLTPFAEKAGFSAQAGLSKDPFKMSFDTETDTSNGKTVGYAVTPTLRLNTSKLDSSSEFTLTNHSAKSIKSVTLYYYYYMDNGSRSPSSSSKVYSRTFNDLLIKKGESVICSVNPAIIGYTYQVYCGVKKIVYTDGSSDTILDGDIQYHYWKRTNNNTFGVNAIHYDYVSSYTPCESSYSSLHLTLGRCEWENATDNHLNIRFQVTNNDRKKVIAFQLYVYAEDVWGDKLYGNTYYYATTTKNIAQSVTVYSNYMSIPKRSDIYTIYCGIKKVKYEDGTIVEVPDSSITYIYYKYRQ